MVLKVNVEILGRARIENRFYKDEKEYICGCLYAEKEPRLEDGGEGEKYRRCTWDIQGDKADCNR